MKRKPDAPGIVGRRWLPLPGSLAPGPAGRPATWSPPLGHGLLAVFRLPINRAGTAGLAARAPLADRW